MDTVEARRSELKYQLALEVLRSFGKAVLPITGASMLPSVWPGDVLEVHRQGAAEVSPGELVVFERAGHLVAHRVVKVVRERGSILLVTRGDRLKESDSAINPEELLGRVAWVLRGNRRVAPRLTFGCRIARWVLCRSELATRLLLRLSCRRALEERG